VTEALTALEERLGHRFADRSLLETALTHSSFSNEASRRGTAPHNEMLEFLGDSVLGFVVADILFRAHPEWGPGVLTKARADLVSEAALAEKGRSLDLGGTLRHDITNARERRRGHETRLADAFEALIAAVYLDAGLDASRAVVKRLFAADIAAIDPKELRRRDSKSALQERLQADGKPLPRYKILSESGPPHEKLFVCEVRYGEGGGQTATGEGSTKKEAQQKAAGAALEALDLLSGKGA